MIDPDNDFLREKLRLVVSALSDYPDGALDAAVQDAASEVATEANDSGIAGQVEFLLRQGWKPDDIIHAAGEVEANTK